jgi:hypothetical protein
MNTVFLTPHDLVERWKGLVTEKTLANWRCSGDGPRYVKIGGKVAYNLEAVKEYEHKREQNTLNHS